MELTDFNSVDDVITFGATVPTGLEFVAREEIEEKLNPTGSKAAQGKVYFQANIECLSKLHELRSVDRLFVVLKTFNNYEYNEEREEAIHDLEKLPWTIPWKEVEKLWRENLKFIRELQPKRKKKYHKKKMPEIDKMKDLKIEEKSPESKVDMNGIHDSSIVRFRASGNRVGKKQSITSPDAETYFGGAVQDATQWTVDLSNYNCEILVTLGEDHVMAAISLTKESLHRRNITHFGYTTLRASIAHNMLRMCKVEPGDVVVDPMCGTGAIPIEGSVEWRNAFYVAADNSELAVGKCMANVNCMNAQPPLKSAIDVLQWDVRNLPWRSGSIDVCITDLPFGKRVGSKTDNRMLYPKMLHELARVSRLKTARACILTHDKQSILKAIAFASSFWKLKRTSFINIGGLRAAVYLLSRTNVASKPKTFANVVRTEK